MKYFQRGGGYYIDVGASQLIADGKIKVKSGQEIVEILPHGLKFADGTDFFTRGASPTDLSLAITDPRKIAAALRGGGPRDGSNLDALQASRTTSGVEAGITATVTGNAAALAQRSVVADAQTAIRDNAVSTRAAGSSVDLDTEAVDLLRFQQAYSAASRVVQVARETFQSIIAIN